MILKFGMQHRALEITKVYINDDWVDLDLFYSMVKFGRLYV